MKLTIAICVCLAAAASAAYVPVTETMPDVKYADKEFLMKQKFFFEILRNLFEPLQDEKYMKYTETYVTDKTKYDNYSELKQFFEDFEHNVYLDKGEIFTIMNHYHMKQTKMLFNFFYSCKDYDTFYKNVIWARAHCNEGMFIYALTLAVLHRPDCYGIVLPAVYEIYPYAFVHSNVMYDAMYHKVSDAKLQHQVFHSNYTYDPKYHYDYFYGEKNDYALSYFTEDVGLNSYYYYFMMDYPFFVGGEKFNLFKDRRGELYLYQHQQLLARYYLERYSHGMGEIEDLDFTKPIKTGYYPMLSYHNGAPYTPRMDYYKVDTSKYMMLDTFKDYEMRIRTAIDAGYFYMEDGTKIYLNKPESIDYLGNLINANPDSKNYRFYRYIEMFGRLMVSGQDFYQRNFWRKTPGAMMHFETMMRDPVFYKLYQRILHFYYQFKKFMPMYTFDEMNYAGVEFTGVKFDELRTYFEDFDLDVSNVVPMYGKNKEQVGSTWDYTYYARNKRINHKPFSYTVDFEAKMASKGVMRVFMGPKLYKMEKMAYFRKYFVEVDQFKVDFVVGKNSFVRHSRDFPWAIRDRTTYTELYKKVMMAIDGKEKFPLDMTEAHCGWPDRLLLPKGHESGLDMTFYFIMTKYDDSYVKQGSTYDYTFTCGTGSGSKYIDNKAFGFPLDREINFDYFYTMKNHYFYDVKVFHDYKY